MEANELRIGNYVNTIQGVKKVSTISVDGWSFHSVSEPIELTQEYLLKIGFKKIIKMHNAYLKDYGSFYFELNETNKNNCFHLKLRNNDFTDSFVGLGIFKYVHQLQNLYFAITAKELI